VFYVKLYMHSLVDKLKCFYENTRCYNKIYCGDLFKKFPFKLTRVKENECDSQFTCTESRDGSQYP